MSTRINGSHALATQRVAGLIMLSESPQIFAERLYGIFTELDVVRTAYLASPYAIIATAVEHGGPA